MKLTRISAALGALILTFGLAGTAFATHVTPTPISNDNNPTCSDFGPWLEVKSDPPGNETITVDGFGEITVSNFANNRFDWSSDFGIDAVLVKAGDDKHNLYVYAAESMGDTGLVPQAGDGNGISHISFCYDADEETPTPTPTPEVTATPEESELAETPTPAPTETPREEELGGTPTPAPAGGSVPDTAMGDFGQLPATVLSLVLIGALAAMVYVRLARER